MIPLKSFRQMQQSTNVTFTFSLGDMVLPTGVYWVGAAPAFNTTGYFNTPNYWHQYTADSDAAFAKYLDTGALYYQLRTFTWKDLDATHLAFTLNCTAINPAYPKLESVIAFPSSIAFNDGQTSSLVTISVNATDLNKGIERVVINLKGTNSVSK